MIASSSGEPNYAQRYAVELTDQLSQFDDDYKDGKRLEAGFASYPDQVTDVDKAQVLAIVEAADKAGRSQAYAGQIREQASVSTFFESEKDEINKKVGGSAQYVAKSKGCNVDLYGTVNHSLKEAIDKQLEKRLREHNEAHRLIERNRTSLSKPSAAALEKQADEISQASYIANIDLVEKKIRVKQMLDEAEQVKRTSEQEIEREKAYQAEPGRTDADKKASDERIAVMNRNRMAMDPAIERGKQLLPELDKVIKSAQQDYNAALDGLKSKLK